MFSKVVSLASLGILLSSGVLALNPWDFERTSSTYGYDSDWQSACDDEFGPNADVADWTQVESLWSDVSEPEFNYSFMDRIGMTFRGADAFVYRNGDKKYQSDRSYFISRHNHDLPDHYLAHDDIDNYLLSLGSWDSSHPILCHISDPSIKNANAPAGAIWIEKSLHWANGTMEGWVAPDALTDVGSSSGPPGALWVEDSSMHWIDQNGYERAYTGTDTGNNPSGASTGSIWIQEGRMHYIDASGNERRM